MFVPTNPEVERIRAEAILHALTDQHEVAKLFALKRKNDQTCDEGEPVVMVSNADRRNERLVSRVVNAITRSRRSGTAEAAQQPVYSPQQATTPGCS